MIMRVKKPRKIHEFFSNNATSQW